MRSYHLIELLERIAREYGDCEVVVDGAEVCDARAVMHVGSVRVELQVAEG